MRPLVSTYKDLQRSINWVQGEVVSNPGGGLAQGALSWTPGGMELVGW